MPALVVALVAAILYVVLGAAVSHAPPHGIDLAGRAIAVAIRFPAWRGRVIYALATTLITWQVSDAVKVFFHRPRPGYWNLIHEPTYAYSSGHAMFAVLVYGLWAWFIWNSNLPRGARIVAAPLLALWGCGVIWSRLALGAHYVSDLAGGVLLAVTALGVASGVTSALRARTARTPR